MHALDSADINNIMDKIGGVDIIVEVDKVHMITRRNPEILYWVIGFICRRTTQMWSTVLMVTYNRYIYH